MNINLLKSEFVLKDIKIEAAAKELNISKSSMYRKIKGTSEFTRKELQDLMRVLDLSREKAMEIFFSQEVSKGTQAKN
jgi:predicted DNA-binding protein YlxM (UPF0122 family)